MVCSGFMYSIPGTGDLLCVSGVDLPRRLDAEHSHPQNASPSCTVALFQNRQNLVDQMDRKFIPSLMIIRPDLLDRPNERLLGDPGLRKAHRTASSRLSTLTRRPSVISHAGEKVPH